MAGFNSDEVGIETIPCPFDSRCRGLKGRKECILWQVGGSALSWMRQQVEFVFGAFYTSCPAVSILLSFSVLFFQYRGFHVVRGLSFFCLFCGSGGISL